MFGSGATGAIPFMNIGASSKVAKYVGKAGTVKRGIVGGLGTALVGEQTRVGIDEKRLDSDFKRYSFSRYCRWYTRWRVYSSW